MIEADIEFDLRSEAPAFRNLPWDLRLGDWWTVCDRLEDAPRGVHRHPVVFVNEGGTLYALKELPLDSARLEYRLLRQAEALHLPAVWAAGHVSVRTAAYQTGILITRYLEGALPYRILLGREGFEPYRRHLLDAIAGLLVEIHLNGIFWGDCSLSNTLFRRDAGALRAYMVDMETAEHQPGQTPPALRFHDLQIMDENITAELHELQVEGVRVDAHLGAPLSTIGAYIRLRYQDLWDEVTHEVILQPGEHFRIQERVRALNRLGFSVDDMELIPSEAGGDQVLLRVLVGDRHFHHDQLLNLTGLDAEEMQAQKMMNEIHEVRARMSAEHNRTIPLLVAAYHWLEQVYSPAISRLEPLADRHTTAPELYCQLLEHKWYLSERAQRDVGHQAALDDYLRGTWIQPRLEL